MALCRYLTFLYITMSLTGVKKELKGYSREQLTELIVDLYQAKHLTTREYLEFMLNPDEEKLHSRTLETIEREADRIKRGAARFRGTKIKRELQRFDAFGTSAEHRVELRLETLRMLCHTALSYSFSTAQGNYMVKLLLETMEIADRNLMLPKYLRMIKETIAPGGSTWYNRWIFTELQNSFDDYDTGSTLDFRPSKENN